MMKGVIGFVLLNQKHNVLSCNNNTNNNNIFLIFSVNLTSVCIKGILALSTFMPNDVIPTPLSIRQSLGHLENNNGGAPNSLPNNQISLMYHRKGYRGLRNKRTSQEIQEGILAMIRDTPCPEHHIRLKLKVGTQSIKKCVSDLEALGLIQSKVVRLKRTKKVGFKNETVYIERKFWFTTSKQ